MRTISIIRAIITLVMEAVRTAKTSVDFYQATRRNIQEGCHLISCREDMKCHLMKLR